jgi:hypothetical protein
VGLKHTGYKILKSFVEHVRKLHTYTNDTVNLSKDGHGSTASLSGRGERLYIGGTKPMYQYADNQKQKWLYKMGVDCIGRWKKEGAILTEAGYKLQKLVDPDTAVEAHAAGNKYHGFGSFQKKIDTMSKGDPKYIDLFEWQKDRSNDPSKAKQVEGYMPQVLKEHVTDWLLCNFDTKGENFLIDKNGQLRGIDKEQSFRYINDPKAQHMSRTYKPNPNNTLYNVTFTKFAKGEMDFDLNDNLKYIKKIEQMKDTEYMKTFNQFIKEKSGGNNDKEKKLSEQILNRKQNLREEYRQFYGELVKDRIEALEKQGKSTDKLKEKYLDKKGEFVFSDERAVVRGSKNEAENKREIPIKDFIEENLKIDSRFKRAMEHEESHSRERKNNAERDNIKDTMKRDSFKL